MASNLELFLQTMDELAATCNVTRDELASSLRFCGNLAYDSDQQNGFAKPMPWIGMYIVLASLFCIIPMVADLLHGLRNRKLWFPCKYFTLNAASLTMIAVAMKLPVDLSNPMSGIVDHDAKLGSMAFMCTMMANLLPSLATMANKDLLTNIIALGVLVITLVVNVCIQIETGLVSYVGPEELFYFTRTQYWVTSYYNTWPEAFYVALLLMLLIIHTCSSLAILKSKQILESQYQACHEATLKDEKLQQTGIPTVEKLKQHVSNYWIMAATGSPQFMTACFVTTSASGVICALSLFMHLYFMLGVIARLYDYKSDYNWSIVVILFTQFFGIVLGSIAPISRCLASLSYKLSIKWFWNHIKVFKVESYWTQKLSDWKKCGIPFAIPSRIFKTVIQMLKISILNFCIGFQKAVVIACKMIGLVSVFFMIWFSYCFRFWKWLRYSMFSASGVVLGQGLEQLEQHKDLSRYVFQLQNDMELAERTLKGISKSVNHVIQKGEKKQPKNLMKLLEKSKGFEGLEMFASHHVRPSQEEEILNCWSLPLVTLTTIAISLPNIQNDVVDCLLSSVSEGLVYVTHVEKILNAADDYESFQKVAKTLWLEVEVYHRWLGNKLQQPAPQVKTAGQMLQWFRDKAKNMVTEVESTDIRGWDDDSICRSISANSMYRLTQTILLSYRDNIDQVSQEELFEQLSSMISDILVACLTNLPQVIAIKCHVRAIEKRESSVHAAAQLLGETTQIMNHLQDRELPSLMNPDDLAFIDNWCAYFKHPFP